MRSKNRAASSALRLWALALSVVSCAPPPSPPLPPPPLVRARVAGFLEEQLFVDGSFVEKNAVLYRLERGRFVSAVERAKAWLEIAKAERVRAEGEYERAQRAVESSVVSLADASPRLADRDKACASMASAEAAVRSAELDLGGFGPERQLGQAVELPRAAQQDGRVTRLNLNLRLDAPQVFVDLDRETTKRLGVPLQAISDALEAARERYRAILMTALSFLLGVIPLVFATGAGAALRRALGAAVRAGRISPRRSRSWTRSRGRGSHPRGSPWSG